MAIVHFIPNKTILKWLNDVSIEYGYSMNIEPDAFNDRIQDVRYPITSTMLHNDSATVRCRVILDSDGNAVLLDIPINLFNELPEYDTETG